MLELSFIPFGAQYYRAPTPLKEDWVTDLTAFKNQGFNTVKLWVQWRWNMPKEDAYDFSDIDKLLDICQELGIKAVLNIICDVAPAWFYKKYPDSLMITQDGRKLHPQTLSYRQIGGAPGPCFHHKEGIEIRRRFIEAAAERYANHPALLCWDLWNEPELTCGVARDPKIENMVCYCDESIARFREWLQEQFTLAELNKRWGRNYAEWDEVEPPRCTGTFSDMVDWREFFGQTLAAECHMRAAAVRAKDKNHAIMVHTVPLPYFNFMNTGSEEYLLAREVDWFGNSIGSHPLPAAVTSSAAKGKWVINAEIHARGGDTMSHPLFPDFEEFKTHILIPFARGIKGFLFWQYKPERLGKESPAWGLVNMDGSENECVRHAQRLNNALQDNTDKLLASFPKRAKIAILNSSAAQTFLWEISNDIMLHYHSLSGAFMSLWEAQYNVDIISEHQLKEQGIDEYDVIYVPAPYYQDKQTTDILKQFVFDGGTLISEALFGGISAETGLYSKTMPGYGFDEVFGCKQILSTTSSAFNNAYAKEYSEKLEDSSAARFTYGDKSARGYYFHEEFVATTGEVIATYENGNAAAVLNHYGEGKAIITGTLPAYMADCHNAQDSKDYIVSLIKDIAGISPEATLQNGTRSDILYSRDIPMAVVLQLSDKSERKVVFADSKIFNKTLKNAITQSMLFVDGKGECVIPDSEGRTELYIVE